MKKKHMHALFAHTGEGRYGGGVKCSCRWATSAGQRYYYYFLLQPPRGVIIINLRVKALLP